MLIAKTGSYTPPFILAAGLIALGPLAFWLILKEVKAAPSLGSGRTGKGRLPAGRFF